jgi:hypothetical protein
MLTPRWDFGIVLSVVDVREQDKHGISPSNVKLLTTFKTLEDEASIEDSCERGG